MMQHLVRQSKHGVTFAVHLVPRAAKNEIAGMYGEALRIRLNAPPVGGAANKALIAFLAKILQVPKHQVQIISGHNSRHKILAVSGLGKEDVEKHLSKALASGID